MIRTKFIPGERVFAIALLRHGSPERKARWQVVEGRVSRIHVVWEEGNQPKIGYAFSLGDQVHEEVSCFATREEADAKLESIAETLQRTANFVDGLV